MLFIKIILLFQMTLQSQNATTWTSGSSTWTHTRTCTRTHAHTHTHTETHTAQRARSNRTGHFKHDTHMHLLWWKPDHPPEAMVMVMMISYFFLLSQQQVEKSHSLSLWALTFHSPVFLPDCVSRRACTEQERHHPHLNHMEKCFTLTLCFN